MQLSRNFTLEEFCASETARIEHIDNSLTVEAAVNVARLVDNVIQKIRDHFKQPVIITSGYRCKKLNQFLGGAANSQHMKGEAADLKVKGYSIEEVFQWCKNNLIFDQLIQEKGQWIHISFNLNHNRKESLRFDGKKYIKV